MEKKTQKEKGMKRLMYNILILIFLLSPFMSSAKKRKKKVYVVDFQDEFVEGHIKNPTIFHLFNKQQLEYDSLVDMKKNFLPELRRTAGEID